MKHDHLMPLPVALEDLRDWLLRDIRFKGALPKADMPRAERALDQMLILIENDGDMVTLLAGYTHACPACPKVEQP